MGEYTRRILLWLRQEAQSEMYVKSKPIADDIGLTARQVGARLKRIGGEPEIPVAVEKWSTTGNSTTWRIETAEDDLTTYLRQAPTTT